MGGSSTGAGKDLWVAALLPPVLDHRERIPAVSRKVLVLGLGPVLVGE